MRTMGWDGTVLWRRLDERRGAGDAQAEEACHLLRSVMPDVETLLAKAGTAPADFTLHDDQHAFRVAQRMAELAGDEVLRGLSPYESALLLLSAYLHDVGMSPKRGRVNALHRYLLTGDEAALPAGERAQLQDWLDQGKEDVSVPVASDDLGEATAKAANLVADYVRARHVDWSDEFIDQRLAGHRLGSYAGWANDLKTLCRSHHEGYDALVGDRFNPRLVGNPARPVHLRYLASLLRVADVLEFDPERTPSVVFEHRDVRDDSVLHWHKDHEVTSRFDEEMRLVVTARPANARMHRAIKAMVDDIQAELQLVRRLDDERPFSHAGFQKADLPHRWRVHPDVKPLIHPRDDAYEYIEGSFRPDTRKVLQLLGGEALYGNPMTAVRELLQNAFDAVREEIAYERLTKPDPGDPRLEQVLGDLHQVSLRLEVADDGRAWLVCRDDGVGMTKALIENHLLVSGLSRRKDIRRLERLAREKGFAVGRTGQFGIGVLSYFMLADRVEIRTRRSDKPGDAENHVWRFESDGIGTFGELRRDPDARWRGTEVRLRLKRSVCKEPEEWLEDLIGYLSETLYHLPCSFACSLSLGGDEDRLESGWVRSEDAFRLLIEDSLEPIEETDMRLRPSRVVQEENAIASTMRVHAERILSGLSWLRREGELPGGLGVYRIHVPIFRCGEHAGGFYFPLRGAEVDALHPRGGGPLHVYKMPVTVLDSWKGMAVFPEMGEDTLAGGEAAVLQIDWRRPEAGTLSISRDRLVLSKEGRAARAFACQQAKDAFADACRPLLETPFAGIASALMGVGGAPRPTHWPLVEQAGGKPRWAEVRYPCTNDDDLSRGDPGSRFRFRGSPVARLGDVKLGTWDFSAPPLWVEAAGLPDLVVRLPMRYHNYAMVGVWTGPRSPARPPWPPRAEFPPAWHGLAGVTLRGMERIPLWNAAHPLGTPSAGRQPLDSDLRRIHGSYVSQDMLDPRLHRERLMEDAEACRGWMRAFLAFGDEDTWQGLREQEPVLLDAIWSKALGALEEVLYIREHEWPRRLTRTGFESAFELSLPASGAEWTLVEEAPPGGTIPIQVAVEPPRPADKEPPAEPPVAKKKPVAKKPATKKKASSKKTGRSK